MTSKPRVSWPGAVETPFNMLPRYQLVGVTLSHGFRSMGVLLAKENWTAEHNPQFSLTLRDYNSEIFVLNVSTKDEPIFYTLKNTNLRTL